MKRKKLVKLSDYSPYPFLIPNIQFDFIEQGDRLRLDSTMNVVPLAAEDVPLVLQGINLELEFISINDKIISEDRYEISDEQLSIKNIPRSPFEIKIRNFLYVSLFFNFIKYFKYFTFRIFF